MPHWYRCAEYAHGDGDCAARAHTTCRVIEGSRYFYTTPDRGIAASLQDLTQLFTGKPACEAWSKEIAGVSSPSFRPTAVGMPRTTLLSQDLLFDGPGGTSFLPGTILMHLN